MVIVVNEEYDWEVLSYVVAKDLTNKGAIYRGCYRAPLLTYNCLFVASGINSRASNYYIIILLGEAEDSRVLRVILAKILTVLLFNLKLFLRDDYYRSILF